MWSDLNWSRLAPCSWQKKNTGQISDWRPRLCIEKACGIFETWLREDILKEKNDFLRLIACLKSKSTLPIVLQNPISWRNSSEQMTEIRSKGEAKEQDYADRPVIPMLWIEVWIRLCNGISRCSCRNHRRNFERNIKPERDYESLQRRLPWNFNCRSVVFLS